MIRPRPDLDSEFRISHKPVIVILALLGMALVFATITQPDLAGQFKVALFAVLLYVVSATAWVLDRWKSQAGRWFTILALVTLVHLGNYWLGAPGFLTLLVIPTALAAALIS